MSRLLIGGCPWSHHHPQAPWRGKRKTDLPGHRSPPSSRNNEPTYIHPPPCRPRTNSPTWRRYARYYNITVIRRDQADLSQIYQVGLPLSHGLARFKRPEADPPLPRDRNVPLAGPENTESLRDYINQVAAVYLVAVAVFERRCHWRKHSSRRIPGITRTPSEIPFRYLSSTRLSAVSHALSLSWIAELGASTQLFQPLSSNSITRSVVPIYSQSDTKPFRN